jgi:hypothetical protein
VSTRSKPGRTARARARRVRPAAGDRASGPPVVGAPNAFWPLACAAAAAAAVFLVDAGLWSPSAGLLGAPVGAVDGALAVAAALLLAAAAAPLRSWWSARRR